jgi:hypothetical protein
MPGMMTEAALHRRAAFNLASSGDATFSAERDANGVESHSCGASRHCRLLVVTAT